MYKTVVRTIPVAWLLEILNIGAAIFNFIAAVVERITSFTGSIAWNLSGLDAYYVFIDDNPIPIHYPKFLIGGVYDKVWFYNVRTREFTYGLEEETSSQYLPALTAIYRASKGESEFSVFDITEYINRMTFKSYPGIFPTPMQLVGAWSLHSGIWPSMMQTRYRHVITMMNGMTAEDLDVDVGLKARRFDWMTFSEVGEDEEVEEDEEEESQEEVEEEEEEESQESDEESQESDEESQEEVEEEDDTTDSSDTKTVVDEEETVEETTRNAVEEMVEESKATNEEIVEAVKEMEEQRKEERKESDDLISKIFEEMNKPSSEVAPNVEETKEEVIDEKRIEEIKKELSHKYSMQEVADNKDIHLINETDYDNETEYFEKVD